MAYKSIHCISIMNTKLILFSVSLVTALVTAQSSFAQSSVQINNRGMVVQSGAGRVIINNLAVPTINSLNQSNRWLYNNAQSLSSQQSQSSMITLAANSLRQPCILSITSSNNSMLTGQITLEGRVIKKFRGIRNLLNLSPYLSRGTNNIKISGYYQPVQSQVKIEFLTPNNKISQQISGNGKLNQALVLSVR